MKKYLPSILTSILAFFAVQVSAQCNYNLQLDDTWGDGWNGGSIDVYIAGTTTNYTLSTGSTTTIPLSVNSGDSLHLDYLGGSSFNSEVSFTLFDAGGVNIYSSGTGPFTGFHFGTTTSCPACILPSGLTESSITSSSATLDWTENNGSTTWTLEYGAAGFTQGTGTTVNLSSKPYVLSGLNSATSYDWYVNSDCGASGVSGFAGSSFTTTFVPANGVNCVSGGSSSVIFSEEFDNNNAGWTGNIGSSGGNWEIPDNATSSNTGADNAHSGANYMNFEASGGSSGSIVSPVIDLTAAQDEAELSFWMHAYGAAMGDLSVGVGNSATGPFTQIFFWSGQLQTSGSDPWQNVGLDLTSYLGQNIYVEFNMSNYSSFTSDMSIDLFEVTSCLSCQPVSALAESNVTTNSADLSWTDPNGASSFDIEYGPSGFTPGSGTTVTTSSSPYSLTGLNSGTVYDWYVIADCGGSNGPAVSSTFATGIAAPWTDDFESHNTTTNSSISTLGWSSNPSGTTSLFRWDIDGSGSTPSSNTGPTNGANSGSNYLYTEASSGSTGAVAELTSGSIDLSALSIPQLSFYYHMYGATMGSLSVDIYDGSSWTTNVFSISGQQQTAGTDPWAPATVNLSAYAGGTIQIRFVATRGTSFTSDISLDDVSILEAPSCSNPSFATSSNISSSGATLAWTENGSATAWEIFIAPTGTANSLANRTQVSSNPHVVTGLSPQTTYDWAVRAICGANDTSGWTSVSTVTTACAPLTAPITESFNSTTLPTCWSQSATLGGPWVFGTPGFGWNQSGCSGIPTDVTGNSGNYAALDFSGSGETDVILEMPDVDVSSLSNPQLDFFFYMCGTGYTPINSLNVDAYDGSTWTSFATISENTNGWKKYSYDISTVKYNTNLVRLRFRANDGGSGTRYFGDQAIDDISILEAPSCIEPNTLSVTALNFNSAQVSWNDVNGASEWLVEYGPTGFTLGTGTQTTENAMMANFSSLSANTAYDWYVQAVCTPGADSSAWSSANTFTTPCAPFTAPYSNDFSTEVLNQEPDCWSSYQTYNPLANAWVRNFSGTSSPFSIPNALYLYAYTGYTQGLDTLAAISPQFSDMTAGDKRITFQTSTTNTFNSLVVGTVSSPENTASFSPLDTITYSTTGSFTQYTIELTTANGYNGSHEYIVFAHGLGSTFTYVIIDDFVYEAIPACNNPSAFSADTATSTSVTLSWTNGGTETQWEIEYDTAGYTQGSGTTLTVNSNPYTVTGLSVITEYDFYVRAVCKETSKSPWTGPFAASTTFEAPRAISCGGNTILTKVLDEEFDNTNFWSGDIGSGTTARKWNRKSGTTGSSSTGPSGAHSGSNYLYYEASSGSGTQATIVSNEIDLTNVSTAELSFWMHAYGSTMGTFTLGVGLSSSGPFVPVFTWSDEFQTAEAEAWSNIGVNLDAYAGSSIYLQMDMIQGSSFYGDMAFDKFEIDACLLPCETPTNLREDYVQDTSAWLRWDVNNSSNIYHWIQWRESGTPTWNNKFVNYNLGRYIVRGLKPNTAYFWQIRSNCDAGWSDPAWTYFRTLAQPCLIPNGMQEPHIFADQVKITWNGRAGSVKYRIRYREQGTTSWTVLEIPNTRTFHWQGGLNANTTYEYQVKSVCEFGISSGTAWSGTESFTTTSTASPFSSSRIKALNDGANQVDEELVEVYPNPNQGEFNLRLNLEQNKPYTLEITDVTGRIVRAESLTGNGQETILPISLDQAQGVYMLRISSGEESTVKRIVIN